MRVGISPHAPYTCTVELYEACAALGLPLATHLSESEAELEYLRTGTGPWESLGEYLVPPLGRAAIPALVEAGVLGPGTVAAHCVQVTAEEIALLAATRGRRRSLSSLERPARLRRRAAGRAPRGRASEWPIATDSPASTPSFDMFDELRAAVMAARARERRPDALLAADALELATLGGARVLGLDDEIGSLVPGKRADITVLSLAGSAVHPVGRSC